MQAYANLLMYKWMKKIAQFWVHEMGAGSAIGLKPRPIFTGEERSIFAYSFQYWVSKTMPYTLLLDYQ